MPTVEVVFSATLPARVCKKGKYYISFCPILDVVSQGPTKKEALKNLVDALSLFFISCFERGTLDQVLKECGFSPAPSDKKIEDKRKQHVKVPIPFYINKGPQVIAAADPC